MIVKPLDAFRVTATFEDHRRRMPPSMSPGVDLALPAWTPVASPCSGRVAGFAWSESGGRILVITDSSDGEWRWRLMHLAAALVAIGEAVEKGQAVALSGNTGSHTTGPHLHLSLTVRGMWVDPWKVLFPRK